MTKNRKVKSVRGVQLHRTKGGHEVVYIRYQYNGGQYRERIGVSMTAAASAATVALRPHHRQARSVRLTGRA